MLAVQNHPVEAHRGLASQPNSASSYFAPQLQNEVVCPVDATDFAATSKSHITRRLAFGNRDTEQQSVVQECVVRSEHCIRHSDVSFRMHLSGSEAKAQLREPVIVPPSCPTAVLWDGGATGPSVLLRHGSGCSVTVSPTLMKDLVSISSDHSSSTVWADIVLESYQASQKITIAHHDSQFAVKELSLTPHNPFGSYCRIVFVPSTRDVYQDVSHLIPQHVYTSALMDLASRMCSSNAPLESLSVFIILAHVPCPSMPMELSLCSIFSTFQVQLSPIKAMAVLDSGVLRPKMNVSQAPIPNLGWLTIDRRRRLIPVLAGDPMLEQFAVVGVFISGVQSLQSQIVSAACTWFNSCCNVNRSLIPEDGSFLLLHCASASVQSSLVYSLFEAHPNFSQQPFSLRCSEFISCHGSAVTLRPQLVIPECSHPFVLAMDQFRQNSSAVSSDFFSGLHEINSLQLSRFTDENKNSDRNLVSPFPEPALAPQPSVCPQFQTASSTLDNPSLVFEKRSASVLSAIVSDGLASNSLDLVQTIIQQQSTISKLQSEKDQLMLRILELEKMAIEQSAPRTGSSINSCSVDASMQCTSPPITNRVTQNSFTEDDHVCEGASAAKTDVAISGLVSVNSSLPNSVSLSDARESISRTSLTQRPSFRSSSSSRSCESSHEFRQKFESVPRTGPNSREFVAESESSVLPKSDAPNPFSVSSKTNIHNQYRSVLPDSSKALRQQYSQPQKSSKCDSTSHVASDSMSFTVPKISYTPLSDDDDSANFVSYPASHAADFSDDSSGSSNS
jgi:hypothetical protein